MTDISTVVVDQAGAIRRFRDSQDGTHAEVVEVLEKGLCNNSQVLTTITCTSAATNASAATSAPSYARYAGIYCAAVCQVAMGQATTSAVGTFIPAGVPTLYRIRPAAVAASDTLHAQIPSASGVVYVSFLPGLS